MSTIGPIPRNLQPRIIKSLAQSFTHRDNPYGNSNPNIAFQRDLDEAMEADDEYRTNPSLPRLLGCNRPDHTRADCHHKNHLDFNRSGQ
jgi:hypothetical protein